MKYDHKSMKNQATIYKCNIGLYIYSTQQFIQKPSAMLETKLNMLFSQESKGKQKAREDPLSYKYLGVILKEIHQSFR